MVLSWINQVCSQKATKSSHFKWNYKKSKIVGEIIKEILNSFHPNRIFRGFSSQFGFQSTVSLFYSRNLEAVSPMKHFMSCFQSLITNSMKRYISFHKKRLQMMLRHHNARVNSHQRWKQTWSFMEFMSWCYSCITMLVHSLA